MGDKQADAHTDTQTHRHTDTQIHVLQLPVSSPRWVVQGVGHQFTTTTTTHAGASASMQERVQIHVQGAEVKIAAPQSFRLAYVRHESGRREG